MKTEQRHCTFFNCSVNAIAEINYYSYYRQMTISILLQSGSYTRLIHLKYSSKSHTFSSVGTMDNCLCVVMKWSRKYYLLLI